MKEAKQYYAVFENEKPVAFYCENMHKEKIPKNAQKITREEWVGFLEEQRKEQEKTYVEKRRDEYPEIGDQLDMIWMSLDGMTLPADAQEMLDDIKAIKAKYHKE